MRIERSIFVASLIFFIVSLQLSGQKADPYHISSGGFGYLIEENPGISLWWCEGAYKIMRDTPSPASADDTIRLWSAANEYEAFQVVVNPSHRMENLRISSPGFVSESNRIDAAVLEFRLLEYVKVKQATDSYGFTGYWPDPLPEATGPVTAYGGENTTFWINVYVPPETAPGIYMGSIKLGNAEWNKEIPVKLEVWDFDLPRVSSLRSGFGLSVDKIARYHKLETEEDIKKTFDLYMQAFRDYRIAPYDPFYLYPVKEIVSGLEWEGGIYDFDNSYSGDYSLMVEDNDPAGSPAARYRHKFAIDPSKKYVLRWNVKGGSEDQQYCMLLEAYDSEGKRLVYENRMEVFTCDTIWSSREFTPATYSDEVARAALAIFPAFRTAAGEDTGRVWIDNIAFSVAGGKENLLKQAGFEVEAGDVDIELDFTDFDKAGERYLDEFGFNSFRLYLKGMGSGTYYSRTEGVFEGFRQGSPVYDSLMARYLRMMQNHLEEKEWLGKEYVYWFDEPGKKDYPFVRKGMETIKRSAPRINTFLTENDPGPEIMDVTDISCTIFHRVDPGQARKITARGQEYWSYLCTAPKAPWVSLFIDHDAINLRIWLWMTHAWKLKGILVWSSNYWDSYSASPRSYMQNPWTEPASFVQGYGWPYGKQTLWGNGDGRFFYPPNRDPNKDNKKYIEGPIPSIRLEFLRQGIEDYEYLVMLEGLLKSYSGQDTHLTREAQKLLKTEGKLFKDGKTYTKNPAEILAYRKKIADLIIQLGQSRRTRTAPGGDGTSDTNYTDY